MENKYDNYEFTAKSLDSLQQEVTVMEDNSRWYPGFQTSNIEVKPILSQLEAAEVADECKFDLDMTSDTARPDGPSLYVTIAGKNYLVRDCGLGTLYSRACLFGSALGRMSPDSLALVLNKALAVSKGATLMLERYGKASAFHSDSGYCVMPISELIGTAQRAVKERLGTTVFADGYNSCSFTRASFLLPDAQSKLTNIYRAAAKKSAIASDLTDGWMPAIRLLTSDTADSSAILLPTFQTKRGNYIRLLHAKKVRHVRSSDGNEGLVKFESEASQTFALYEESAEAIKALCDVDIYNATNVVIGLCNKLRIPKKYGETARETVERFAINTPVMTAYDIYLAMADAIAVADENNLCITAINMSDQLAATLSPAFDWNALDVGGIVAWGGKEVA